MSGLSGFWGLSCGVSYLAVQKIIRFAFHVGTVHVETKLTIEVQRLEGPMGKASTHRLATRRD
jgi:hypothetical protein